MMENVILTPEQLEIANEIAEFARIRGLNLETMTDEDFQALLDAWWAHVEDFYRKAANTPTDILMEMTGFKTPAQ
jgi:hypothetical protein